MIRRSAALAVLLAGISGSLRPETSEPRRHFRIVDAGPGCYAAVATPGSPLSTGNAGFVIGTEGILVVDAFASEAAARDLFSEIRRRSALPVRWIVHTRDRPNGGRGDAVFRDRGAVILAPETDPRAILPPPDQTTAGRRARPASLLRPDVAPFSTTSLWLGGRTARVLLPRGDAAGDLVVAVEPSDVVYTGRLFWNATVPDLLDAGTATSMAALEGFTRDFPAATFVPRHGEPGRALQVRFFRDYLAGLRQAAGRAMEAGLSGPALTANGKDALRPRYGAWTGFDQFAARNLEQTEREMRQKSPGR